MLLTLSWCFRSYWRTEAEVIERGCQKLTYKFHLLILLFDSSFACNIFCYSSMKFELKPLPSKNHYPSGRGICIGDLLLQYKFFFFLCSMFLILMLGNAKTTSFKLFTHLFNLLVSHMGSVNTEKKKKKLLCKIFFPSYYTDIVHYCYLDVYLMIQKNWF